MRKEPGYVSKWKARRNPTDVDRHASDILHDNTNAYLTVPFGTPKKEFKQIRDAIPKIAAQKKRNSELRANKGGG